MIFGLIIWIIFCALVASWAEKKGHKGIGYLFLSIFLSPLVGAIVVACISDKTKKICPYCKRSIDMKAVVCSYCGKELKKKLVSDNSGEKEKWISQRILELISAGSTPSDAKIQAEAEFSVNTRQSDSSNLSETTEASEEVAEQTSKESQR